MGGRGREEGIVTAHPKNGGAVQGFKHLIHCSQQLEQQCRGDEVVELWCGLSLISREFLLGQTAASRLGEWHPSANVPPQPGSPGRICSVNYQTGPCVISLAMKSSFCAEE